MISFNRLVRQARASSGDDKRNRTGDTWILDSGHSGVGSAGLAQRKRKEAMKNTILLMGLTSLIGIGAVLGLGMLIFAPNKAQASAKFTQETGKACNFCHAPAPPALNDAGKKFKENGNKL